MPQLPLQRRTWLAQGAAFLGAPWALLLLQAPATAADHPVLLEQLLALSRGWTGRVKLDEASGAALLAGLLAARDPPRLQRELADAARSPDSPLAATIIAAWYSGVLEVDGQARLLAYGDALLWQALDFTKPPGQCGGATGYWAAAP